MKKTIIRNGLAGLVLALSSQIACGDEENDIVDPKESTTFLDEKPTDISQADMNAIDCPYIMGNKDHANSYNIVFVGVDYPQLDDFLNAYLTEGESGYTFFGTKPFNEIRNKLGFYKMTGLTDENDNCYNRNEKCLDDIEKLARRSCPVSHRDAVIIMNGKGTFDNYSWAYVAVDYNDQHHLGRVIMDAQGEYVSILVTHEVGHLAYLAHNEKDKSLISFPLADTKFTDYEQEDIKEEIDFSIEYKKKN